MTYHDLPRWRRPFLSTRSLSSPEPSSARSAIGGASDPPTRSRPRPRRPTGAPPRPLPTLTLSLSLTANSNPNPNPNPNPDPHPPPTRHGYDSESRHGAGTSYHGFPVPAADHTAGGAPPAITPASPRDVAVRYAEQRRVAAESRSPYADEREFSQSSYADEPTPLRLVTEARA